MHFWAWGQIVSCWIHKDLKLEDLKAYNRQFLLNNGVVKWDCHPRAFHNPPPPNTFIYRLFLFLHSTQVSLHRQAKSTPSFFNGDFTVYSVEKTCRTLCSPDVLFSTVVRRSSVRLHRDQHLTWCFKVFFFKKWILNLTHQLLEIGWMCLLVNDHST